MSKTKFFLIALILSTLKAQASTAPLPESPKPQNSKIEYTLLATDAAFRMLDVYSTRRVLTAPCHCNKENVLPDFISHDTGSMIAYSVGVVGFNYILTRELKKHNHAKLAKFVYITDIAVEASTLHNFTLRVK